MLKQKLIYTWLAFVFLFSCICNAEEKQPVAIRHWPDGGFTFETMWNLHVGIGLTAESKQQLPRAVDYEFESMGDSESVSIGRLPNESTVQIHKESDEEDDIDILDEVELESETESESDDSNEGNEIELSKLVPNGGMNLDADGVFIVVLNGLDQGDLKEILEECKEAVPGIIEELGGVGKWHLCVVATDEIFTESILNEIMVLSQPEILVVNSDVKKVGSTEVEGYGHNTIAISSSEERGAATRIVSLATAPYRMAEEVADLFAKKEAAQKSSREMFAKLSVDQMNFKPANGSHTPRWNAEHMMGRELLFFSQIFNAVDPSIPVMNLNPKQMPEDYEFAHPDWTGEEEALQMKRVEEFTRRYAYLLDGMNLDRKAKGSRWTPRKLLMQMERHYNEHSANVVKKMKLDGWPQE